MKIGLLEAGKVNPDLVSAHGTYPEMFSDFIQAADPAMEVVAWDVVERDQIPSSPHDADGWLITGSKYGVYDDEPWIDPLKRFLAQAHAQGVPIVGICFGHQILVEALGGQVEKSDRGWGCGVHAYEVVDGGVASLGDGAGALRVHAMHQDQVVKLPESTTVLARSEFCPYAALAIGDTTITMQPHPEFSRDYESDLIRLRSGVPGIPKDVAAEALESLKQDVDNAQIARWVARFFRNVARS